MSALNRKLSRFAVIEPGEFDILSDLMSRQLRFAADIDLVREQQIGHKAYVVIEGWACAYKLTPDGGRQIINFAVPGDFMGLRSVLLRTSDHSFSAVTNIIVAEISAAQLLDGFHRSPRLAASILWAASRDEAMVVEHLVGLGRRDGMKRTGHLLVELAHRLRLIGQGSAAGYDCPLNQYILADALGLTAIHVNRVLRQLRERNLVTFRDGHVAFSDLSALEQFVDWDGGYLDQEEPLLKLQQ